MKALNLQLKTERPLLDLDAAIRERHSTRMFLPQLAIPAELSIICGLAVGYPDPDFPANKLHVGREPIAKDVVFLDS